MSFSSLNARLEEVGLVYRGGFRPTEGDGVPDVNGAPAGTLILVGNVGSSLWAQFAAWHVGRESESHPLDAWSTETIRAIADDFAARAVFPFGGPPYHPFVKWAQRAEPVWGSRLGLLIHGTHGLWHAYRGALVLPHVMALPVPESGVSSPCDTCVPKPCLRSCPVGAMTDGAYDLDLCVDHLAAHPEGECMRTGCLARGACPVGAAHRYAPAHAQFHMSAFLRGQLARRPDSSAPA